MKAHLEKIKAFDAYYKPIEDCQERTFVGGTVSILCWTTIFFLTALRVYEYCTVKETLESIFVDSSRSPKLWINLDIVIPRISCDYVSLDAMDSSGEQHLHIDHNIYKRRLDKTGSPIEEPKKEDVRTKAVAKVNGSTTPIPSEETTPACGSCYGAEDGINNKEVFNITCCNTCEEVRSAYRRRGWQFNDAQITQCKSSATSKLISQVFNEGCQIYGYMEVNRVSGRFHIAPGQSFTINHVHVHDVQPFSSSEFNTTHHIRHLSFGKTKIQGNVNINPLDETYSIADKASTMFNYYIKIVPTMYVNAEGETIHTNQFSVTKHQKVMNPMSSESGMPGVFFNYEISAMMVKITDKPIPLSHLVTDLCSIIGGVWVVSMFIDTMIYRSSKLLHKIDLGKAS